LIILAGRLRTRPEEEGRKEEEEKEKGEEEEEDEDEMGMGMGMRRMREKDDGSNLRPPRLPPSLPLVAAKRAPALGSAPALCLVGGVPPMCRMK
jgi:hypothetical protein